jgi:hypothetical protein
VNLDRFGQARDYKIPFVGQTVSPTPRRDVRIEVLLHKADHNGWLCTCVQIQITAKVWPVIERFDYGNIASF